MTLAIEAGWSSPRPGQSRRKWSRRDTISDGRSFSFHSSDGNQAAFFTRQNQCPSSCPAPWHSRNKRFGLFLAAGRDCKRNVARMHDRAVQVHFTVALWAASNGTYARKSLRGQGRRQNKPSGTPLDSSIAVAMTILKNRSRGKVAPELGGS